MSYSVKDFKNPYIFFETRTLEVGSRIKTLCNDLEIAQSVYTRAIILSELEVVVDDYIERQSVLERDSETIE